MADRCWPWIEFQEQCPTVVGLLEIHAAKTAVSDRLDQGAAVRLHVGIMLESHDGARPDARRILFFLCRAYQGEQVACLGNEAGHPGGTLFITLDQAMTAAGTVAQRLANITERGAGKHRDSGKTFSGLDHNG